MRILMIANYLPYPQLSGGRIRVYNLLRRVAERHEVALAALLEFPQDAEGVSHLQGFCATVQTADLDRRSRLAKAPGMLRYALAGRPPELRLLYSAELVQKIRRLFSKTPFDIVQIESVMGLYLEALPKTRTYKSLQMFQNVAADQFSRIAHVEERSANKLRAWLNGVMMGRWEPRYAENFDRCTTVSELDRCLLTRANPRLRVEVIPNGVDLEKYRPLPAPSDGRAPSLLFVGNMGYTPCVDGVLYFCRRILPLIRRACNPVRFRIVGANPPPDVLKLHGSEVEVTGRVEDVVPYYQASTVCVVPLRAGGGTRLKILEAMALGRPVVTTAIGCEGLDVVHGEHLLIADSPEQFAEHTVRVLRDRRLAACIADNARQLVEARYGWDKIAERLMAVYEELHATGGRRA